MDDLLIAAPTQTEVGQTRDSAVAEVKKARLEISTSEIQKIPPWKYLGWMMTEQTIKPQKISFGPASTQYITGSTTIFRRN